MPSQPRIMVGFIPYEKATARYLPHFLKSLKEQTYKNIDIAALDNSAAKNNENRAILKNEFPEARLEWAGVNLGFGKAYNRMINIAKSRGYEYFLAVNPDMIFEPDMIERLYREIIKDNNIGAVTPKILRWNFEVNAETGDVSQKKTDLIDSYGMFITRSHRFSDINQGEKDNPEKTTPEEVFGFTGAAVLLRMSALTDIAYDNGSYREYFDELMFMYKEDCDISYRLRLAGWKIIFVPGSVAYHDRTAVPMGESSWLVAVNRKNKSRQLKKWSYQNQWILILKMWPLNFSLKVRLATVWYQLKCFIYLILFERFLLSEFRNLWLKRKEISKKSRSMKVRIRYQEIEKFMR